MTPILKVTGTCDPRALTHAEDNLEILKVRFPCNTLATPASLIKGKTSLRLLKYPEDQVTLRACSKTSTAADISPSKQPADPIMDDLCQRFRRHSLKDTFVFFAKLPVELQLSIWKEAVAAVAPRVIILSIMAHDFQRYPGNRSPSLLYTCHNSRSLAKKRFYKQGYFLINAAVEKRNIYLDLDSDILLVGKSSGVGLFRLTMGFSIKHTHTLWCNSLRYAKKCAMRLYDVEPHLLQIDHTNLPALFWSYFNIWIPMANQLTIFVYLPKTLCPDEYRTDELEPEEISRRISSLYDSLAQARTHGICKSVKLRIEGL